MNTSISKRFEFTPHRTGFLYLPALLAIVFLFGATDASAAECDANTRSTSQSDKGAGVKTTLVNHTDTYVGGAIYRNDKMKDNEGIRPGGEMTQNATTAGNENEQVDMRATFSNDLGGHANCTFKFTFSLDNTNTKISKVTCDDGSKVCNGCTLTCTRGYDPSKAEWQVRLHLNPPDSP